MSTIYQDTASDPWLLVADLRRQLEERTAERDEALDQQAAAAEVLQVVNSSPGDLAPLFDAMLDKAMRLCEFSFGALLTYGDDGLRVAATSNVPPGRLEAGREAEHYRRARSRGAASDRPAARLRPRLTQEVHHRLHPNAMVNC